MYGTGNSFHYLGEGSGDFTRTTTRMMIEHRDPLYLFARHLEWRDMGSINAYQDLVAALDDPNKDIRAVAEMLMRRSSPHP